MAQTGQLTRAPRSVGPLLGPVTWLRIGILLSVLVVWEAVARSGILLRDVVPSLVTILQALAELLGRPDTNVAVAGFDLSVPAFYWNLYVTLGEVVTALLIGGTAGLLIGLVLGANPFLSEAFERYLYYLGPTPKIVFFPVMIMWFGVGPESKVAMGTLSCFFPVVLSVAAGMRQIDPVLIRVGRSFRLRTWQMVTKVYLPAMREPIINGARIGMGVALIGTLLAETKLSNRGVGFMIIDAYNTFDMPRMYAVLLVLFVVAIGANTLVGRASRATTA
jgi:ABC-type nitrate/sulfonate/bicarbonate transport system permease component